MILVTGATGTIGREVVARLPRGAAVRVLVRDPARMGPLPGGGEVVAGDYGDPASLAGPLTGVRVAFLVTVRPGSDDDANFVAAARTAGVRRIVKLSAAAVLDAGAADAVTAWQRGTEALLRDSGLAWTLVRPRSFMSHALSWAPSVRAEGVVRTLFGTSANSCVDPRDVAACVVRLLTQEGHAGRSYVLSGPRAVTAVEQTADLGRLLRRPLRHEELTLDAAGAAWRRRYPAAVAEALLASARRQQAGAKTGVSGAVRELTGHEPRPFTDWARDHLAEFAADASAPPPA
ncbi:NAD(P)H-binding protein [Streptomyces sp. NPDC049813]|uniref:NAD(P)H-binding protein n=1 Tax=Streptomyces sp. NPDC049813 TaxID=3365597 RepID=UPI00379D3033